jgi:hypothetical protein
MYPPHDLVRQFARDGESWFRQFCALPSEPVHRVEVAAVN